MENLIDEIMGEDHGVVTMNIDNMFAINLAKNPVAHERSKHIEMRFHYLREQANNGRLVFKHCRSKDQVADSSSNLCVQEIEEHDWFMSIGNYVLSGVL
jgi:hypothetical protein